MLNHISILNKHLIKKKLDQLHFFRLRQQWCRIEEIFFWFSRYIKLIWNRQDTYKWNKQGNVRLIEICDIFKLFQCQEKAIFRSRKSGNFTILHNFCCEPFCFDLCFLFVRTREIVIVLVRAAEIEMWQP